jgi:RHS repeat-associated protein
LIDRAVIDKRTNNLYLLTKNGIIYDSTHLSEDDLALQRHGGLFEPFLFVQKKLNNTLAWMNDLREKIRKEAGNKKIGIVAGKENPLRTVLELLNKCHTPLEQLEMLDRICQPLYESYYFLNYSASNLKQDVLAADTAKKHEIETALAEGTRKLVVYENPNRLSAYTHAILDSAQSKIYFYRLMNGITDSITVKGKAITELSKGDINVFYLYRGWLEGQLYQLDEWKAKTETAVKKQRAVYKKQKADSIFLAEYDNFTATQLADMAATRTKVNQAIATLGWPSPHLLFAPPPDATITATFTRGMKRYELADHRGNVLTTISDRKTAVNGTQVGQPVTYYKAVVLTANDHYPYGMMMPGRNYNKPGVTDYRYGFNGKENDNEVKNVEGGQQDYGMRIYDPRLGRFLSVDPITAKYPELTPFQFASNTPVQAIDLDGLEKYVVVNNYDKYGRVTKIRVESIVTIAKKAIDQDFKIRGSNNDLTKKTIYIQHRRNGQFIAPDNSRNGELTKSELLAYNTSIVTQNYSTNFDKNNGIAGGDEKFMGSDFLTSNGRVAYSYLMGSEEGVTHNYKEGERSFENSRPIFGSKTSTGWVFRGGTYSITNDGVQETINGEFGGFEYMIKTEGNKKAAQFLSENGLNVGFLESAVITYAGKSSKSGLTKMKSQIENKFSIKVTLVYDPNIEVRESGINNGDYSAYSSVKLNFSGVKDGDNSLADKKNIIKK